MITKQSHSDQFYINKDGGKSLRQGMARWTTL